MDEEGDRPIRVLIAEDETIIRLDLEQLLEEAGFDVCAEAKDGDEAVELARSEQPDLAVLDVKMPKLDGIEAARADPRRAPDPDRDADRLRAGRAGLARDRGRVFGYLMKPFRERDLLPRSHSAGPPRELVELREETESLAAALAARKTIERAKGLLMEREGLSEDDAFARLRKASQVSGRPMQVVAEAVLATFGTDL